MEQSELPAGSRQHVDAAEVGFARDRVERGAKDVLKATRELAERTFALEQAALFGEVEFEEALFYPVAELRKRYTAEQATKMEWRRNACIRMLAYGIQAKDIAKDLHMNLRTISALATQNGKMLAGFSDKFAQELMTSAAADIALAETKRDESSHIHAPSASRSVPPTQ